MKPDSAPAVSVRHYGGSAPENYERYFVPTIGDAYATALLDVAGLELVLIGVSDDAEGELGIHLEPRSGRLDLLRDLRLDPREHPLRPLTEGAWT